jgi:hypothetical protein
VDGGGGRWPSLTTLSLEGTRKRKLKTPHTVSIYLFPRVSGSSGGAVPASTRRWKWNAVQKRASRRSPPRGSLQRLTCFREMSSQRTSGPELFPLPRHSGTIREAWPQSAAGDVISTCSRLPSASGDLGIAVLNLVEGFGASRYARHPREPFSRFIRDPDNLPISVERQR